MSQRTIPASALYLVGLVAIVAASHLFASAAFEIYDRLPDEVQRSGWTGPVLNEVAPCLVGVACAILLVQLLVRRDQFLPTSRGHMHRSASWYLFAVWVLGIIYRNHGNVDFGLWSQIVTWPLAGTIGALITDALLTWRASRVKATSRLTWR